MRRFADSFGITAGTSILDVGGYEFNWSLLDTHPDVTLLNLDSGDVIANGCYLPFRDKSFDVAFSNSVIEHLGTPQAQRLFATEIRRVARAYFVQTPNRWFLIEPHYLTPLVQFVPRRIRVHVARFTVWALITHPTYEQRRARVNEIRLLSRRQLRGLFPDGRIRSERFLGMSKAFIVENRWSRDVSGRNSPGLHVSP